jgi:predicted MFS family arabinose efflux permease
MVVIQYYFQKRRALATGIIRTGGGIGILVFPPIVQILIDKYSWKGAMILLAGFSLQGCVAGALLRPNAKVKAHRRDRQAFSTTENLKSSFDLFIDSRFLIFLLIAISEGSHTTAFYNLSPDRVVGFGFTTDQAAFLLFLAGISSTLARLVIGFISNFFNFNYLIPFGCAFLSMAISHFLLMLHNPSYSVLVVIYVVFGLGTAVTNTISALLVLQLFGLNRFTFAFGWALFAEGVGGFVGAPVGGTIFDKTGSYTYSFLVSGAVAAVAAISTIPVFIIDKLRKNRASNEQGSVSYEL